MEQRLDLEPVLAQQPDPFAVGQVEGRGPVRVLDGVEPEIVMPELFAGRLAVVGPAEDERRSVHEEDELPAGTEQPGRLADPAVRIGPDGRAVLRHREIE
jgi:hypothetical protein